jgi:hypothetical protein
VDKTARVEEVEDREELKDEDADGARVKREARFEEAREVLVDLLKDHLDVAELVEDGRRRRRARRLGGRALAAGSSGGGGGGSSRRSRRALLLARGSCSAVGALRRIGEDILNRCRGAEEGGDTGRGV